MLKLALATSLGMKYDAPLLMRIFQWIIVTACESLRLRISMYSSPSLKLESPLTFTSAIAIELDSNTLRPVVPLGNVPLKMSVSVGAGEGVRGFGVNVAVAIAMVGVIVGVSPTELGAGVRVAPLGLSVGVAKGET